LILEALLKLLEKIFLLLFVQYIFSSDLGSKPISLVDLSLALASLYGQLELLIGILSLIRKVYKKLRWVMSMKLLYYSTLPIVYVLRSRCHRGLAIT
jgi:hypothetical protein